MRLGEKQAVDCMHPLRHTCNRAILNFRTVPLNEVDSLKTVNVESVLSNNWSVRKMSKQEGVAEFRNSRSEEGDKNSSHKKADVGNCCNDKNDSLKWRWDHPLSVIEDLESLLYGLLALDPNNRLTAWQGLQHEFFDPLERSGQAWAIAMDLNPPGGT